MVRSLHSQFPGAIYHVVTRGDGGKAILENKDDCDVGEDAIKDHLLGLMEKMKGRRRTRARKGTAGSWRGYSERDAEDMIPRYAPKLDLPTDRKQLQSLCKGDERKALLAGLRPSKTTVNWEWLDQRLEMEHPGSVSRILGELK